MSPTTMDSATQTTYNETKSLKHDDLKAESDSDNLVPEKTVTELLCDDPAAEFHKNVKERSANHLNDYIFYYSLCFLLWYIGAGLSLILMPDNSKVYGSRWYENRTKLINTCVSYLAATAIGFESFSLASMMVPAASKILSRQFDTVERLRGNMKFEAQIKDKEHAMYFFLRHVADPNLPNIYNFDQLSRVKIWASIVAGNLLKVCCWQTIGYIIEEDFSTWAGVILILGIIEAAFMARLGWFWGHGRIARTIRKQCLNMSTPVDVEKAFGIKHTPTDHLASYLEFLMVDKKGSKEAQRKERVCLKVLLEEIKVPTLEGTSKE
ncbi:hypothetical protein GLAREA_09714 [Glarea lozoyensis ATCC 20868]|uniref:Uncharacterized protein n=1 Tax=Glarea lozoyensis (strain ATCC 20868 / MF5171) TaxID=1116229 RepID=S3DQ28_GLAL2|nr:uncharacterized protein GLAREA_09714 [Glarea lozoyensis ATCC 20868]EPE28593.1 hypothetical protein GLAREA_09714 [Glarea lozoyensis ATCC 20868]